jgi:hypothetical protein
MTTELDLTPDEITELKHLTEQSDVTSAVQVATREYLQYARRQQLKALSGRIEVQDNWRQLEALELKRPNEHAEPGSH